VYSVLVTNMVGLAEDDSDMVAVIDWLSDWGRGAIVLCNDVVVGATLGATLVSAMAGACAVCDVVPFKPPVTVVKLGIVIVIVGRELSPLVVKSSGS